MMTTNLVQTVETLRVVVEPLVRGELPLPEVVGVVLDVRLQVVVSEVTVGQERQPVGLPGDVVDGKLLARVALGHADEEAVALDLHVVAALRVAEDGTPGGAVGGVLVAAPSVHHHLPLLAALVDGH